MVITGPLVSAANLAAELAGDRPPRVLDVRWALHGPPGIEAYRQGHIPAASYVDLDRDLAGPPGRAGRHPLPDPQLLSGVLRRNGIGPDTEVVVYDAADSVAAARAWWVLRHGCHHRVRVLDGGLSAWRRAGLPLSTEDPETAPAEEEARGGCMPVLDAKSAAATARTGVLIDARIAERYRGERESIDPIAGHVPGALNAPTGENLDADGCFLPADALRARFEALGVRDGVRVGAYCGSGVTAAHTVLGLAVAGLPAALYVGSWSEWITDTSRPVARGPEPG